MIVFIFENYMAYEYYELQGYVNVNISSNSNTN